MTYFNLPVHGHILELVKETDFCNCYQFCADATVVSKKFKEEIKKIVFSISFFSTPEANNSLNYQFKL